MVDEHQFTSKNAGELNKLKVWNYIIKLDKELDEQFLSPMVVFLVICENVKKNSSNANFEMIENVILNQLGNQNQSRNRLIKTRAESERKLTTQLKSQAHFKQSNYTDHGQKTTKQKQSFGQTYTQQPTKRTTQQAIKSIGSKTKIISWKIENKAFKGGVIPDSARTRGSGKQKQPHTPEISWKKRVR